MSFESRLGAAQQPLKGSKAQRPQELQPAYSVEKLVSEMSSFVARIAMRGLRSG